MGQRTLAEIEVGVALGKYCPAFMTGEAEQITYKGAFEEVACDKSSKECENRTSSEDEFLGIDGRMHGFCKIHGELIKKPLLLSPP